MTPLMMQRSLPPGKVGHVISSPATKHAGAVGASGSPQLLELSAPATGDTSTHRNAHSCAAAAAAATMPPLPLCSPRPTLYTSRRGLGEQSKKQVQTRQKVSIAGLFATLRRANPLEIDRPK